MKGLKLAIPGLLLIVAAVALNYLVGGPVALTFADIALIVGIVMIVKGFSQGIKKNDEEENDEEESSEEENSEEK